MNNRVYVRILSHEDTATGCRYHCPDYCFVECVDKTSKGEFLTPYYKLGSTRELVEMPQIKVPQLWRALEVLEDWLNLELVVGKLYRLVGGKTLRFAGVWGKIVPPLGTGVRQPHGYCLAFIAPSSNVRVGEMPGGYAASRAEVLYRLTAEHVPALRDIREQMVPRGLNTEEIDIAIEELK